MGPGLYDQQFKTMGSESKGFKIGERRDSPDRNDSPGPCKYEPSDKLTKDNGKAYDMGKASQRAQTRQEMSPGPGTYDSPKKFGDDVKSVKIQGRP